MTCRVGVDTGGTHTDIVLIDETGHIFVTLKVPTTPEDHSVGVMDGLRKVLKEAGLSPDTLARFAYGTTLVTNLLIARDTDVPVGLITTDGFRDILEIRRAVRGDYVYDIHWRPAPPLVPRHLRLGVPERIDSTGQIVIPLDEEKSWQALRALARAGVESIAVCLMNSYANPVHERRIAELARQECPEIDVSLSCDVARQFREYERTSTTVVNAYVRRPITRHLVRLSEALRQEGVTSAPYIMRSNGGLMTFDAASQLPAAITHSGPTAGVVAGTMIAEQCGISDIITIDMGGTSADVSLISGGQPVLTSRGSIENYPVVLPMLDLVTIGAGGGSIAWVDQVNILKVGPRSAGAVPGPACYGQGGSDPTITDANLLLGRLDPEYFLGGARKLRLDLAETATKDRVARRLGMSVLEAARGIVAIAEAHMMNAIKQVSVQRGFDPRDFTLVAFGGAGPLHAIGLAQELAINRVLVPAAPGNVSAMGLLAGNIRHDFVLTKVAPLGSMSARDLSVEFDRMLREGRERLKSEGVEPRCWQFILSVDLCYKGQNYELSLPLPSSGVTDDVMAELPGRFHGEHQRTYGYSLPHRSIKLVNLRLTGIGVLPGLKIPRMNNRSERAKPVALRHTMMANGRSLQLPIYRFGDLCPEQIVQGPTIVEYVGSTLFIQAGWTAAYDRMMNAHLSNKG